ncbi:MAG: hypothetical protein E7551_06755 [Ruminococcaceae bacterium]|nr:hypothetical protein [Oscillospiraceae bacterium]
MKRILAIGLVLLTVISSTTCLFFQSVNANQNSTDVTAHFENTDNWHLEKISSGKVALGTGVPSSWSSWANIKNDSAKVYNTESEKSVKVSCNYHSGWVDLPDLEANSEYTLNFWYSAPNGYSGNSTAKHVFSTIGIYSPTVGTLSADVSVTDSVFKPVDGYFIRKSQTSKSSYSSVDGTAEKATPITETSHIKNLNDSWHNMTFTFNSGDLNDFIMLFTFDNVTAVYFDSFTLTKSVKVEKDDTTLHFEDINNWHLERIVNGKVELGTGVPSNWSSWANIKTDTSNVYNSEASPSVKVSCNYHSGWVDLPDLEPNHNYTLSFYYTAPNGYSGSGNNKYAFSTIGVYSSTVGTLSADVSVTDSVFTPVDGYFVRKSQTAKSSYKSKNGTAEKAMQTGETSHIKNSSDTWHNMTLTFDTGNLNDFIMLFTFDNVTAVYFDNFTLTDNGETPPEEPEPPEHIYESHFENPENWGLDRAVKDSATGNQIATLGSNAITWAVSAETSTNFMHSENSKESFFVSNAYHASWVTLPSGLEPNTNYTLGFWYYTDGKYSGSGKKYYAFESIGIYSSAIGGKKVDLTAYSYNGYLSRKCNDTTYGNYVALNGNEQKAVAIEENTFITSNEKAWQYFTLDFNSSNLNDLILVFKTNVDTLYLDDFEIFKTPEPIKFHNGAQKQIDIDFEKEFEYFSGEQVNRMEVAQTENENGDITNALHIFEGDYSYIDANSVTILNHKAITKGTDKVFCIPVFERTTYKMSVKVRVEEPKEISANSLFLLYADYSMPIELAHTPCSNLANGEWRTFEAEFVTGYGQEYIKFFFNFGVSHPEIWIDDISLTAYSRGYIGETKLSYCENFFNLVDEMNYETAATVTEKTIMEIPVTEFELHTLGITLSGSGKVSLAFEEDGSDLIWSQNISEKATRYGENFMAGEKEGNVYLIFEPTGEGISYKENFIFRTKAVNFRTDMGFETLQNTTPDPIYTLKSVDADAAINGLQIDTNDVSPATGDSSNAFLMIIITFAVALLVLVLNFKKTEGNTNERT